MLRAVSMLVTLLLSLFGLWHLPSDVELAEWSPVLVPESTVYQAWSGGLPVVDGSSSSSSSSTSTSVVPVVEVPVVSWVSAPAGARCGEWWLAAQVAGWPAELLPVLDWVMWRESRCLPGVEGNGGLGLLQLQWSAHSSWLSGLGVERGMLFEPMWNLAAGWYLWQLADGDGAFRCGWSPWYMSAPGVHWCDVVVEL